MNSKKHINLLLTIIAVLVVALAACIGYIMGTETKSEQITIQAPASTESIKKEWETLKAIYDAKIKEKTSLYKALEIEKEKVRTLVLELDKTKHDAALLLKYKNQYKKLENKMLLLITEIKTLKNKKAKAAPVIADQTSDKPIEASKTISSIPTYKKATTEVQKNSTKSKTSVVIIPKKETVAESVNPTKNIEQPLPTAKKTEKREEPIIISNLQSVAYHMVGFDQYDITATTIAKKTDLIRISFTLDANSDSRTITKKYYVQVINGKNNVLGLGTTEYFDEASLTYSFSKIVRYEGLKTIITHDLVAKQFDKGNYTINIYDRNKLVGKTNISLQ